MDAMKNMIADHPYIVFYPSTHSVTSFYPKPNTHFGNSDILKVSGACTLVSELMGGSSSEPSERLEMEEMNVVDDVSEEDFDSKSKLDEEVSEESDGDERCVNEILYEESVKTKLEFLAGMVGVDSSQPADVLTEVVRVLKDLERERRKLSYEICNSGVKM
ncbi:uncharacterized protein LOC131227239 [Magnolia sinica]|uniref:uncharacterized protein LOC131227239 n=1 Tax=Magnolia sinica TaxID=86752 RepID=UPI0026581DBB|nr:uncharacterized protein LOC131227239 [Magnolia sinica]